MAGWDALSRATAHKPIHGSEVHEDSSVACFRSLTLARFEQLLLPALVSAYDSNISALREDNQRLRALLELDAEFDGNGQVPKPVIPSDGLLGHSLSQGSEPMNEDRICDLQSYSSCIAQESAPTIMSSRINVKTWGILFHAIKPITEGQNPRILPVISHSKGLLGSLVFSTLFETISACIILANTIVMAMELQYEGLDHESRIRGLAFQKPAAEAWPWAKDAFLITDVVFNTLFTVELVMRVFAVHVSTALRSGWLWFDFIVIGISIVDLVSANAIGINPGMMRVIRLVRLLRLLKVFHSMSGFDSLFLLVKAVEASMHAAIWSLMVLGLVQVITGLFLCQLLQGYFSDTSQDLESQSMVFTYFGTFSRTMLTMFEITFSSWNVSCRLLVEHVSEWFSIFYIGYRCLFLFAVLKVIAAVFITETNRVLEHDDELTIIKANREMYLFERSFERFLTKADINKDGKLNWKELEELLKDEQMLKMLPTIGFDSHDVMKLFWLSEDDEGEVTTADFFSKLCKLKGPAKKINELATLKLVYNIHTMLENVWSRQGLIKRNTIEDLKEQRAVGE